MKHSYNIEIHGETSGEIDVTGNVAFSDIKGYIESRISRGLEDLFKGGLQNLGFSLSSISKEKCLDPYDKLSEIIGFEVSTNTIIYIHEKQTTYVTQAKVTDMDLYPDELASSSDILVEDQVRCNSEWMTIKDINIFKTIEEAQISVIKELKKSLKDSIYLDVSEVIDMLGKDD
jgi:hypothetical protein